MASITLLRHSALSKEFQKRFVGHSNIEIDLSLVNFLQIEKIKKIKYDLVFSSDLKRCTQTLDLIDLEYETDSRIREVEFKKEFALKNFDEIQKDESYDEKYLDSSKTWHEYICEESFQSFKNRVKSFLDDLPKDKNILICSHAGTIRMMNSILTNYDYENDFMKINYLEDIKVVL